MFGEVGGGGSGTSLSALGSLLPLGESVPPRKGWPVAGVSPDAIVGSRSIWYREDFLGQGVFPRRAMTKTPPDKRTRKNQPLKFLFRSTIRQWLESSCASTFVTVVEVYKRRHRDEWFGFSRRELLDVLEAVFEQGGMGRRKVIDILIFAATRSLFSSQIVEDAGKRLLQKRMTSDEAAADAQYLCFRVSADMKPGEKKDRLLDLLMST